MISLTNASDQYLVELLREGSSEAYIEIYNRYKWLLHTHAYKKLGDREATNDLIQELFTSLWMKRSDLSVTSTLSAYLFTAVRNRVLNIMAHDSVQTKYLDSLLSYANRYETPTDHLVREKQLMVIIEKEIAALPPKMRDVFELSRKSHLTHKQIAEQLHISEQTVTKQIKNALSILRKRLGVWLYILLLLRL